eukprot:CAMPEP_0184971566 /NCGR_PEP_ID=MMETSP1098-20130426/3781_1 /TAXON_ID=89044 /ORGANISM="Spumella elongata, Strain CCAP 955/1" /LENGTH=317 /DNA_ID=CAMNT_0027493715 /DNA_START=136 /DNA_END=1089 /DNA_ORIENTATION=+
MSTGAHQKSSSPSIPEPSQGVPVDVKAYYIARGIEIVRLHGKLYPSCKQEYQPKSVTITVNETLNQHISIFSYGSVVLFNIPEEDHGIHIRKINELSILPFSEVMVHSDSYKLLVHENLEAPSVIHNAHMNIRSLNSSNITIVSVVMAQTVALDYYAGNVAKMVEKFAAMNTNIQEAGKFTTVKETDLYKMVASNNSVFTNVLSKLGFFEGTDVAWENAEYTTTWEALRKEFELDSRYNDLSLKLNIINEDARFFLSVLQHQKSSKLEWIIIILIAGEMIIGLIGLGLHLYDLKKDGERDQRELLRDEANIKAVKSE